MQAGRRKSEEGAGVVEFALIAPLFILLLFGLVEFGQALYTKEVLTNASREGARFGVVYCTPRKTQEQIRNRVQEYLQKAGFREAAAITVVGAQGPSGQDLRVSVSYPYEFQVLPRFVAQMLGTVQLTATTVMKME